MFNTHTEYIDAEASEKIVLAHLHGFKRLYNFSLDGGLYSRTTEHFVTNVKLGTTQLTSVSSTSAVTDATKFFYDLTTSKLYLFSYDNTNDEIIAEFRFFLSNVPINLSWDLQDLSPEVEYLPNLSKIPNFKSQMSQGKKGLKLTGNGNLTIDNYDGEFDSIYDTIIFENKSVNVYSYNRDLDPSDAKFIFRGIISEKTFNAKSIVFKIADDIYKLDSLTTNKQYGTEVLESDAKNYKRTIYGRGDSVICQSLDKNGESSPLTGTIKGILEEDNILGTGTLFLSELSPGDEILIDDISIEVIEVRTDTKLITSELDRTFDNKTATMSPKVHYYSKNRTFQLSDHAIKKYSTTITAIQSRNRIVLDDVDGFFAGDSITIGAENKVIRRVSGNTVVLTTNYNIAHTVGDVVFKNEIFNLRYDNKSIQGSLYSTNNTSSGLKFTLDNDAEVRSTSYQKIKKLFSFYTGRRTVWLGTPAIYNMTCVANVDGSLYEKYFIIQDANATTTAFWFKDLLLDVETSYVEPSHGADNSVAISLTAKDLTAEQVATEVQESLLNNVDYFNFILNGTSIDFESIEAETINTPTMNTSGFSITQITVGLPNGNVELDLATTISPRDWLKSSAGGDDEIYEVLSVRSTSITLRSPFLEGDEVANISYKDISYITDESNVYIDCYGKTKDGTASGEAIITGADAVEDILKEVGLGNYIESSSFANANIAEPATISLVLPQSIDKSAPKASEAINIINQTVMGSLYINDNLNLGYNIIDVELDLDDLLTLGDNDIIKWSTSSDNYHLALNSTSKYNFKEYNPVVDDSDFTSYTYTNDFVEKYIETTNTIETDLYLYDKNEAEAITARIGFINSLGSSKIKITGKLSLEKFNLGQKVILDIDRLYIALGSTTASRRIGVISSIVKDGVNVKIEIEDLGSLFDRASRVTADTAVDYSSATDEEKVLNSYIVDDNEIIGTDEDMYGTNLIG